MLGSGKRVGIWVCGCKRACKGCSNPELWDRKPEYEVTVEEIIGLVNKICVKLCAALVFSWVKA